MWLRTGLATLALATFSCGGGGGGGGEPPSDAEVPTVDVTEPDAELTPSCRDAQDHSDFTWLHENVFFRTCANFTQCHDSVMSAGRLNMVNKDTAYAELLGPSYFFPTWNIVEPGSPADSYVLVKLRCPSAGNPDGESCEPGPIATNGKLMPPDNQLCQQKIDAVVRWIEAGAPND